MRDVERRHPSSLCKAMLTIALCFAGASIITACGDDDAPSSTATASVTGAASPIATSASGTPGAPAAPATVLISGALPDLTTPVPEGQGEQGRITVSWDDESTNEDGFRIYQECGGTTSELAAVTANETQIGPLQACRPGRVGVASFNAAGTSAIVFGAPASTPPSPPAGGAAPSAPSSVNITGPIPDLRTAVPAGQGELGRITVAWTDNSDDETGFRIYQDCAGTVSQIGEVPADETQLGPLQPCRPGRVGVASFNATSTSAIVWAS
ncbi:MAG TPA: hypothetical protein VIH21_12640 [Dehalococcoidia bacterium]